MQRSINQDTLVPIGLAVTVIGFVTFWAAGVRSDAAATRTIVDGHTKVIEELIKNNENWLKQTYEINSRFSRLEWRLEKQGK